MFFPAALAAAAVFGRGLGPARQAAALAAALLQPAALLIDHGHFQYNHLCLGLAVPPAPNQEPGRPVCSSAPAAHARRAGARCEPAAALEAPPCGPAAAQPAVVMRPRVQRNTYKRWTCADSVVRSPWRGPSASESVSACAQAGAAAAVAAGRPRLGSALFCLALNHKQMVLYFAPAFFAHLLGCALRLPGPAAKARGPARGTPAVATPPARKHGRRRAHAARA